MTIAPPRAVRVKTSAGWVDLAIQGPPGAVGATGSQGPQGSVGATGAQGPIGNTGPTGPTGPASVVPGPTGPTGAPGAQGAQGPQGVKGDTGAQGVAGPTGNTGAQGPQGATGATGAAGITYAWRNGNGAPASGLGIVGDYYLDDTTGNVYTKTAAAVWTQVAVIKGPTGATGPQGTAGTAGTAGATGATGSQGLPGAVGATGPQGPQGVAGPQGVKGDTGATGVTGPTGPAGPQGPTGAFPPARGARGAAFNLGNGYTVIPLDYSSFDPSGMFSVATGRFTVATTGYYRVSGMIRVTFPTINTICGAAIFKNGTFTSDGDNHVTVGASQTIGLTVNDVLSLTAGDYVQLAAFANVTNGALYVGNGGADNYMTVQRAY